MLHVTGFLFAATALGMDAEGADVLPRECEADHECSIGFCYVQIGKCTPCIECSQYLRHAPKWSSCAKMAQECGSCLDGFEEEVFVKGVKRDLCVPSRKPDTVDTFNDKTPVSKILCYSVGAGVILLIIFIAVLLYYKRGRKTKPQCSDRPCHVENVEAPPPPYTSSLLLPTAPVATVEDEVEGEIYEHLLHVVETRDTGSLQKAVPFQDPSPPYNNNHEECGDLGVVFFSLSSGDERDDQEEEVAEAEDDFSDIDIHNAETMPSDWTPGDYPGYATVFNEPPTTEQGTPEEPSSTSSLSSLREPEAANVSSVADSGVSAFSSSQSVSSSSAVRYFRQFGEGTSSGTVTTTLSRSRSEDDITSSNPAQPPKRARRDSGSVSMHSGPEDE